MSERVCVGVCAGAENARESVCVHEESASERAREQEALSDMLSTAALQQGAGCRVHSSGFGIQGAGNRVRLIAPALGSMERRQWLAPFV